MLVQELLVFERVYPDRPGWIYIGINLRVYGIVSASRFPLKTNIKTYPERVLAIFVELPDPAFRKSFSRLTGHVQEYEECYAMVAVFS